MQNKKVNQLFFNFTIRNIANAANVTDYTKNRSRFSIHVVHELKKLFIPLFAEELVDEVGRAVVDSPELRVTVSVGRLRAGRKV